MSSLVPQESREDILTLLQGNEGELWLFEQTGLQSSTIGFTWDTSFLMGKILRFAGEAETFEEFVNAVKYFRQCCYEFLEPCLTKIFEKVKANPEWIA